MELKPEHFKKFLPKPLTLITTIDGKGIVNAAPYACVMPILRPLNLVAFASALPRDTLRNIRETKEFVVNVMGRKRFKETIKCAKTYPPHIDELKALNIESFSSKKVTPPRVKDAIGWIETILKKEITGEKYSIIIGEVVCAEINDNLLKANELPVVLFDNEFRILGEKIGISDDFSEEISTIKF